MPNKVTLYALSTCGWCRKTKRYLESKGIEYTCYDVDLLDGVEKDRVREELAKHNPRRSYPTVIIDDDQVVVGFDEEKLDEAFQR